MIERAATKKRNYKWECNIAIQSLPSLFLKKQEAIMLFKILLNKNSNQSKKIVYTDEWTCGFVGTRVPNEAH